MPRVTIKGQITIPRRVRAALKIKAGDDVEFTIDNGRAVIRKTQPSRQSFRKYVGALTHLDGKDVKDIIDQLRGPTDDLGD